MAEEKYNKLGKETSPYLLQHANNPVDWHPWDKAALEKAAEEDKPIFLSIGYSACHWCHVMAHESFEDTETAGIMNKYFVNIKVDREERPDIDKIYQIAQQILTGQTGGWPLSMFLHSKDQVPFFGGTYFPLEAKYNLPAFKDVLIKIADVYQHERDKLNKQNEYLMGTLQQIGKSSIAGKDNILHPAVLDNLLEQLKGTFDSRFGGFGHAPKFPQASSIEYILRHHLATNNKYEPSIKMAELTLTEMACGGIYDQLAGGFYRYSVDERWMIPHFEKMLYDNGLLLTLYSQAWQITRTPLYQRIATETADWVMNEMQDKEGGYYSSLDADSEGEEGQFYTWTRQQIRNILNADEYTACAEYYGLNQAANFSGKWHLRIIANDVDEETLKLIERAKVKLLKYRATRIRPHCDTKILTSWNALMIKGMATATFTFNTGRHLHSADRALNFIYDNLYTDGRLLASYRDSRGRLNAYLDDYAFLIDAILAFLRCRWDEKWLFMAIQLADQLLAAFLDKQRGGFFFTAHDHERLIQRGKYFTDDALPSGNAIAAHVLYRLGHLVGESRYMEAAELTLKAAWPALEQHSMGHSALLGALYEHISPGRITILFGSKAATEPWREKYRMQQNPFDDFFSLPACISGLPGTLGHYNISKSPVAYICQGGKCRQILSIREF